MEKIPDSQINQDKVKMYEIPGHYSISEKDLSRYNKDKKQDELIKKISSFLNVEIVPEEDRSEFVKRVLENENREIKLRGAEMICMVPEEEQEELKKIVFNNIQNAFLSDDLETKIKWAENIPNAPEEKRDDLIKKVLSSNNLELQLIGAREIFWVSKEAQGEVNKKILDLIEKFLNSENIDLQLKGIETIKYISKNDRLPFIKKVLSKDSEALQLRVADIIDCIDDEKERILLIKKFLASDNPELQLRGVYKIWTVSKDEQEELRKNVSPIILNYFNSDDSELQLKGAEIMGWTPNNERSSIIKHALTRENPELHFKSVRMIRWIPKNEQEELRKIVTPIILNYLNSDDLELQLKGADMIEWASENEKENLKQMVMDKGLIKYLINPPLYNKHVDMNKESFSRRKFEKTGSGTTLIGGSLKDKIIIRHINPDSFVVWQKLYEDYHLWQNAGFDYVPIEPIQSYKLNKNTSVDVYTGVLDMSLERYLECAIPDNLKKVEQLKEQRDKIIKVLDSQKINHGHTHDGNFCLRFFRDEKGEPDLNKTPRLYLIDFDQSAFV